MADRTVNVNNDTQAPDPIPVATDFDGVADHQYVKLEFGPSGTQTKVAAAVGLPVNPVQETAGVGVGAAADAEAVGNNNGSVIALLKRLRTLLSGGLPAALTAAGNLRVAVQETSLPVVITRSHRIADVDNAQADAALLTVAAPNRIVLTALQVLAAGSNTVDVAVRVGLGLVAVPAPTLAGTDKIALDHPGIKAGGGVAVGDGSGVLAIGAADEDLRLTCADPVGGAITVTYSYYLTT